MSDAIRGQCRLCGKPEESHHWHPLAHGGIVRNGRPGYLHCPTNSCDVCTECGENREKHRCPNGATFYTAHSVAQPTPIAGEEELVEKLAEQIFDVYHNGDSDWNDISDNRRRVWKVSIAERFMPIIRAYVAERVKEAERQEREACAKILEDEVKRHRADVSEYSKHPHQFCEDYGCTSLEGFVKAIRARSVIRLLMRYTANDHVHGGCDDLTSEAEHFLETLEKRSKP